MAIVMGGFDSGAISINSAVRASLVAHRRDPRIDFARGIALWFMLLDHIPQNAVNLLTLRNFGFSGAIDVFVFVSGYAAAILYGKMTLERGSVVASSRVFKRAWQLYAAHLVLFVVYINAIGWVAKRYAAPDIIEEYHITGILTDPVQVLTHGLLLVSRPLNLDILQLAIVLLGFFPLALAALLRWPNLTLLGSVALYVAAHMLGFGLPAYPAGSTYLNPFCWQVLFVLGAWCALNGAWLVRAIWELSILRLLALAYLVFALLITVAAQHPAIGNLLPDFLTQLFVPNDRADLGPYRLLHFIALAFWFTWLVSAKWEGFGSKLLQPVIKCGDEWLTCFCVGIFLSLAGHFVLITGPNSLLLQVLVSVAVVTAMTSVAYYVSWSRQQDRGARYGAPA